MRHLILVGAVYLDTILTVPHFPQEDSKLRATSIQVRRGGNVGNTLEVFAQLLATAGTNDLKVHLVACLPESCSPATAKILSSFGTNNVGEKMNTSRQLVIDFGYCLYRSGHQEPASSYIIRSTETGSRTIVNSNPLPEMTADEFKKIVDEFLGDGDGCWWHFEGRIPETTLQCIRHLRRATPKCTISVEVEKPGRDGLTELAAEADIVFYSRTWAQSRGYPTPEACLRGEAVSSKALLMCCTWGEDGAGAFAPSVAATPRQADATNLGSGGGGEYVHCPVPTSTTNGGSTITVVDTIGAGDTFIAGMLYSLLVEQQQQQQQQQASSQEKDSKHSRCDGTEGRGDDHVDGDVDAGEDSRQQRQRSLCNNLASSLKFAVELATKKVQQEGFAGLLLLSS